MVVMFHLIRGVNTEVNRQKLMCLEWESAEDSIGTYRREE